MRLTKRDIIQKLYDIEEKYDLKLGKEVQKVVRNEMIPLDIITLINKYDKEFLQIYDTFNTIYNSRNKNPLYRNLKNTDLVISEKAIAMSSLVTKILISCSKIQDIEERKLFASAMGVDKINQALTNYAMYNDESKLLELSQEVKDLLQLLYSE